MLLHRILEQSATRWPDREALISESRRLTYAAWNRRVNRVANGLADRGVEAGGRVGLLTRNRIEQATAYFAVQKVGAIPVPMNFRLSRDDLVHLATKAKASVLLYDEDEDVTDLVTGAAADLETVEHYFSTADDPDLGEPFADLGADASDEAPDDGGVEPTDLALMQHTSGTTGRPKLVETNHRGVWANALACGTEFTYSADDRSLNIAPLFHSADYFNLFIPTVMVGGANVMQPYFDAERALEWIESESITATLAVPTHVNRMRDRGVADRDVSSMRLVITTAAPIADDVIAWVDEHLTDRFYNVYGLTETTGFVTLRDRTAPAALPEEYCIGKPFLNVDVRLIELGEDVPPDATVEQGERGRLIARAPKLMRGYYEQPEKTAETLVGDWLYTGDVVKQGPDGRYYMIDRIDHAINSGGETIYPLEIERGLRRHPGIEDAAVSGEPDEDLGERVVADVVPADASLTAAEIERWWKDEQTSVAGFKRPREIRFVDELPEDA